MAKDQQETLINERDVVSGVIENGKDTAVVSDQLAKYDADSSKEDR